MMGATHVAGGPGGQGMYQTWMSPSTTGVLLPVSMGVWTRLSSRVGVGGRGTVS